jgi:flagellar basal body-associated protein FliL
MEGKLALKQELLERMKQILGEGVVRRIYFTEFVIQ